MEKIWLFRSLKSRTLTLIASFKELLLLSKYSSSGFLCKSDRICGFRWAGGCWAVATLAWGGLGRISLLVSCCPTRARDGSVLCHQLGCPRIHSREGQQSHSFASLGGCTWGSSVPITPLLPAAALREGRLLPSAACPRSLSHSMVMFSPTRLPAGATWSRACPVVFHISGGHAPWLQWVETGTSP